MSITTHAAIAHLGRHRSFLVSFAKRLGASHADAQDCAQVALTKAWQHIDDFSGTDYDSELRYWLSAILKNHFFDRCRRARNHAKYVQLLSADPHSDCRGEEACEISRLISAIDALSRCQRVAITGYLLGEEYQQIADQLGLPLGTVKSRISRAREALSA